MYNEWQESPKHNSSAHNTHLHVGLGTNSQIIANFMLSLSCEFSVSVLQDEEEFSLETAFPHVWKQGSQTDELSM